MTNILLSRYDISKRWCFKDFKKYLKKGDRVAVVAFSFRDGEISSREDWDKFYGEDGIFSKAIEKSFKHYGIHPEDVEYIDYFRDNPASAKRKIQKADIIYLPGGAPEKIMSRVIEFDLYDVIENHDGVVIGFGAGAQVQLANYHITGDDRGNLCYSLGFRFAEGFYVEVDYARDETQNHCIRRVVTERGLPVFAIGEEGAVIVDDGIMSVIGDVSCFRKREAAG
ncbi:MAG: Type 1 glutamine amidotransferase-like domain-containing protein [Oscillospiraceae bacterium]|jgi:hypothetical protein|nr:Type 1 glutamine amidotransferase-like domain-containing protein [Oscillospiraceae bacterium]